MVENIGQQIGQNPPNHKVKDAKKVQKIHNNGIIFGSNTKTTYYKQANRYDFLARTILSG